MMNLYQKWSPVHRLGVVVAFQLILMCIVGYTTQNALGIWAALIVLGLSGTTITLTMTLVPSSEPNAVVETEVPNDSKST